MPEKLPHPEECLNIYFSPSTLRFYASRIPRAFQHPLIKTTKFSSLSSTNEFFIKALNELLLKLELNQST